MLSRNRLLAGTALAALLAATHNVRADVIATWNVSGDFSDGGTFSGSLSYDTTTDNLAAWNIMTAGGTSGVGSNTYSSAADGSFGGPDGSGGILVDNYTGVDGPYSVYMVLDFTNLSTTTPSGTLTSLTGYEGTVGCFDGGSDCLGTGPSRTIAATVPEPASGSLALAGIALLGAYRRRRHAA